MSRRQKICLFTDHHLSINPRLWKEAFFYEKNGFDVVVHSMWTSKEFLERDYRILNGHRIEYKCYLNLIDGEVSPLRKFYYRLRKRIALEILKKTGIESGIALTYSANAMYRSIRSENADLYVAHMESAMIAAEKLIKDGLKVGVDFEDWYSQDYLFPGRPVKLLRRLEINLLNTALFATATSQSMADALINQGKSSKSISVIYNGFSQSEKDQKQIFPLSKQSPKPKLLWFSRNIGPDRGIETLFECLLKLDISIELHLLGKISDEYKEVLIHHFPNNAGHELKIHEFIDHNRLLPFIAGFDIGLALEESPFPSRDVTITNKLLQYLQGKVKILATDTKGQMEVAHHFPEIIEIVKKRNAEDWARGLAVLIRREASFEDVEAKFDSLFSWEAQEDKLKTILRKNNFELDTKLQHN